MKTLKIALVALLACLGLAPQGQAQSLWRNQSKVLSWAEALSQKVELLDEALHTAGAPEATIEVVHHFEETVLAAVEEFGTLSYEDARVELEHLRQDIFLVYDALKAVDFAGSRAVLEAWNVTLPTYIGLERSLDRP